MNGVDFTSAMLEFEPRSIVRLALDPLRSNSPFAFILIGSVTGPSEKSCKVMISGKVFNVCDPEILLFEANFLRFELKLGAKVDFCGPSSKSHDNFFICRFGVFGIEKTSLDTSKVDDWVGGSESRLTAFSFFDSVGVFGDCTTRTGWGTAFSVERSLRSRHGKFLSFLHCVPCELSIFVSCNNKFMLFTTGNTY